MPLPIGTRLGPYAIEAPLGAGGMGEVYRARDTRLDRLVAIKILPQQLAADPQFRRRFEREARSIAALTHPNICTLHDIGHEDDVDFLVMEYLEGQTLAQRLSAGPLPFGDALLIAIQIGEALCHAHDHGIVHRDLKPANVMLTGGGAKLLDFGLAKKPVRLQPSANAEELTISQPVALTLDGIIVGTVGYMSPEQAAGRPVAAASDIFSFGVILYEMLTQRRPFARETAAETLAAIIRDTPRPVVIAQSSEQTTSLRRVVERCLAKDPAARYSSMRDVTAELEEMRRGSARPGGTAAPILERRMITALTMDIGSRQDVTVDVSPERLKHALDRAVVELTALIRTEGGLVEHSGGDAIHAVFGAPAAHADDPLRALRAAHACVQWTASDRAHIPCAIRAGIETGEAVVDPSASGTGRQMSVGACLTVAARLQQLADPGQVLVGPICHQASSGEVELAELGDLDLKGMGRVPVWRLVAIATKSARDRLPLVGRQEELDLLQFAYRRACGGRSVLALVSGPPGQGKSRLLEEFVAALGDDARVLQARCRSAGEPGARNPLLALLVPEGCETPEEELSERLATLFMDPLERDRVLAALSHSAGLGSSLELTTLPGTQSHDEIANGWRRYFSALSTERPVVVWIDDLHLADAELVRLLDRLTFGSAMPLLVIATARPEFQPQSGLRSGADRFFVTLDKLEPADAHRLAILASGPETSPIERAEGNPLFIIELARARLRTSSDVPVTLHGVIGARLDELPPADRELLERAAVVGETFSADDASLLSARNPREVAVDLDRLCTLGYLRQDRGGLRFHHALVRDVAYGRLTAGHRMRLHARYARDGVPPEDAEALAHHLWEAVGPDDADWVWEGSDDLVPLRVHARAAHLAAARRCAGRFAYARAIATCRRAFRFAAMPLDVAQVEQTLADVCAASGDVDEGATHYLRARELYGSAGIAIPADLYPSLLEHVVYTSGMFRRPLEESLVATLLQEGEETARRAGDTSSLARIHALRAYPHDAVMLADALRLAAEVSDPAPLASLLGHAAILFTRVGEFALAKRTYEQLDAVASVAGSTDRQLEFRAILALNTGSLDEAARLAEQFMASNASRGAHLRTHAFREQGHVLLARGDWGALRDLDAQTDRLVAAHHDTAFCYAVTTVRAFALVARALEADIDGARARLPQVEEPLQAEPIERESVLALVYGVLGKRKALSAIVEEVRQPGSAPYWFFQRTYAVTLAMLESWDELDGVLPSLEHVAAKGSPYLVALVAALREEMAAARGGGPTPAHAALRRLGYLGWSRLLAYRPST